MLVVTIDPERITQRLFGGPHLRTLNRLEGGLLQCPKTKKVWDHADFEKAWMEGYDVPPVNKDQMEVRSELST